MAAAAASKLRVQEYGEGPTLLLIAGLGQAGWVWREVAEQLGERRRVLAFDHLGTGRSPGPARATLAELVQDALSVLDERANGPIDLLGFSMGGYVALTIAHGRRAAVRSLVLVGTGAGGPGRVPRPRHVAAAFSAAFGLPHEEFARRTMHYTFARGWTEANPERFEALVAARLEQPTPYRTLEAHVAACYGFYADGCEVERIQLPALVVHGDEDLIVPAENGRRLAARLPRAEYVELAGRGHNVMLEAPEELSALVTRFLGSLE